MGIKLGGSVVVQAVELLVLMLVETSLHMSAVRLRGWHWGVALVGGRGM
jgi:hypothetical protein